MIELKALGDVCEVFNGSTPLRSKKEYWDNGTVNWFTVDDIRNQGREINYTKQKVTKEGLENTSMKLLPPKTVLVCCTASVGEYAISNIELTTNQQFNGLVIRDEQILIPKYLFHFASTLKEQLISVSGKTTIDFVSMTKLKKIQIPTPPLPEQERIVAKLDKAFAAIDQAKANVQRNLQNAKELFQSKFEDIFNSRDESWSKLTLLELLEKNWITSHLDGNHGGDYPRKHEFVDSGIKYISANCLKKGYVDFKKAKYLTPERAAKLRKGIAQNEDVLFAHNATVGPTALLITDEPKVILGTSLTYYRCNKEFIEPEYLLLYLRSKEFTKQYESVMTQSTRNQVPITKQREFYHLLPPIVEQQKIIPQLNLLLKEVEKYEKINTQKITELEDLKKSLLERAFKGKL